MRRDPVDRALKALGEAVPPLEDALGFPVSVTAQARPDGTLSAVVIIPDASYGFDQAMTVSAALQNTVRPYGLDLNVEVDSDAPYAE